MSIHKRIIGAGKEWLRGHLLGDYTPGTARRRNAVNWLERELPDPAQQREYAQERAIVAISEALGEAVERAGMSQAELARRLALSPSRVSQIFHEKNLTLRTVGDVLWACGLEVTDLNVAPLGIALAQSDDVFEWDVRELFFGADDWFDGPRDLGASWSNDLIESLASFDPDTSSNLLDPTTVIAVREESAGDDYVLHVRDFGVAA